jgi:Leucine-rich repeat (LRR) protein
MEIELKQKLEIDLENLKKLNNYENYFSFYFGRLRDQIDLPFFVKSETEQLQNELKLNENWQQLSNKIKLFESDCLKTNTIFGYESSIIDLIQNEINENHLNKANYLLNDLTIAKIEKKMLKNRTILWLDNYKAGLNHCLFRKMDPETTMGKLIIVTNSYLGPNASEILINTYEQVDIKKTIKKYKLLINNTNKQLEILKIKSGPFLTNELIKCLEFQKQLYNNGESIVSENQIIETKLDFTRLTHLDISENELTEINENLFRDLTFLQTIWICSNRIEYLNELAFNNLPNLKHLSLSNNQLTHIDMLKFKSKGLTHLFLANNQISRIDKDAFKNFENLVQLSLFKNLLISLDSNLLSSLTNLKEINLSNNNLEKIDSNLFRTTQKLVKINLSMNKLVELDCSLFKDLIHLESIYLADNKLKTISIELFHGLSKIKYISLFNNDFAIHFDRNPFKDLTINW